MLCVVIDFDLEFNILMMNFTIFFSKAPQIDRKILKSMNDSIFNSRFEKSIEFSLKKIVESDERIDLFEAFRTMFLRATIVALVGEQFIEHFNNKFVDEFAKWQDIYEEAMAKV